MQDHHSYDCNWGRCTETQASPAPSWLDGLVRRALHWSWVQILFSLTFFTIYWYGILPLSQTDLLYAIVGRELPCYCRGDRLWVVIQFKHEMFFCSFTFATYWVALATVLQWPLIKSTMSGVWLSKMYIHLLN